MAFNIQNHHNQISMSVRFSLQILINVHWPFVPIQSASASMSLSIFKVRGQNVSCMFSAFSDLIFYNCLLSFQVDFPASADRWPQWRFARTGPCPEWGFTKELGKGTGRRTSSRSYPMKFVPWQGPPGKLPGDSLNLCCSRYYWNEIQTHKLVLQQVILK